MTPGSLVKVDADSNDHGVVRITAVTSAKVGEMTLPVRDPARPRAVTRTGQVAIPAEVLASAGLSLTDRVYLALDRNGRSIRLLPTDRVTTISFAGSGGAGGVG